MKHQNGLFAVLIFVLFSATGCFAPINSNFETAATVPKGRTEAHGSASFYRFTVKEEGDRESGHLNSNIGLSVGTGLSSKADLKFRYELMVLSKDSREAAGDEYPKAAHFISLAPKLVFDSKKTFAMKVPIGLYLYDDTDTWTLSPQMLVTPIRKPKFDLTATAKVDIWLDKDSDPEEYPVGFTLGAGFGKDVSTSAFRPEMGVMFEPAGDSGVYLSFGAAFTKQFGGKKASR